MCCLLYGLPFAPNYFKTLRPGYIRFASQLKHAGQASHQLNKTPLPLAGLGLSRAVRLGVKSAFPTVIKATDAQTTFVPAIIHGKDVMIKGDAGSGKSFGLILALLSKYWTTPLPAEGQTLPTSLLLVPHRDLAYQFSHWTERIVTATGRPPLSAPTQVVVRDQEEPSSHVSRLREKPPSILIATPQAILDILHEDEHGIDFSSLGTVVVDEVDSMVDFVPAYASKDRKKRLAAKMTRHPSPGKLLLDQIYAPDGSAALGRPPQLVICSATLQTGLRQRLYQNGWFRRGAGSVVKVRSEMPAEEMRISGTNATAEGIALKGEAVQHCGLVFSEDGNVRDVEGAVEPKRSLEEEDAPRQEVLTIQDGELPDILAPLGEEFAMTASPFNPVLMEGIASIFATDVPKVALLVLPASAPVQRALYDLRILGINAFGLDLLSADKGQAHLLGGSGGAIEEGPTLLVSTTASTRGIDLPDLSHVFIWGVVDTNSYLHASGRVGRFGREGKVVSVLEERPEGKDEASRYLRMLKSIDRMPSGFVMR